MPLNPPLAKGGLRGLANHGGSKNCGTAPVGFASLYPPYGWIPACAGMTEAAQEKLLPGLGVSPIPFIFPQDWGTKGVDETQPGAYQVVR